MGRRRVEMELISNERKRYVTYQKRKKGLEKKAYELSILCDVRICLIIYGPKCSDADIRAQEPNIWPKNPNFICNMIDSYRKQSESCKNVRTRDLVSFYDSLAKKTRYECDKLYEPNNYLTWDERFNSLSSRKLKQVISQLEVKVESAKERIESLKGTETMFFQKSRTRYLLGALETEGSNLPAPSPPPIRVGRNHPQPVGTNTTLQMMQQTSYNNNTYRIMNCGSITMNTVHQFVPYHCDHHLIGSTEVMLMKNHEMVGPGLLLCLGHPSGMVPLFMHNLSVVLPTPYGLNLPPIMVHYNQHRQQMFPKDSLLEMHSNDVTRKS